MKLSDTEQAVFDELERYPYHGITKSYIADLKISYNLGDLIMKLRRKGADITTEMKLNPLTRKNYAVYRMK